jgi:1-deoxy-D-xylulose-5-phosphate reductoisomerase
LDYPSLTFEQPDTDTFRNLALAYAALKKGGNIPCVLNAANEIAVQEFLRERISFLRIADLIEETMMKVSYVEEPNLDDYLATDEEARIKAFELIK